MAGTWKNRDPARAKDQRNQYLARNRAWSEKYKLDRGCNACGLPGPSYVLDFHHCQSADKASALSRSVQQGHSIESLEAEAAKCVVLCANCHRIATWGDLEIKE